jgi:hypothetical protein
MILTDLVGYDWAEIGVDATIVAAATNAAHGQVARRLFI